MNTGLYVDAFYSLYATRVIRFVLPSLYEWKSVKRLMINPVLCQQ